MKCGEGANIYGAVGCGSNGFAIFPDFATGFKGVIRLLTDPYAQTYVKGVGPRPFLYLTIAQAVNQWCPLIDAQNPKGCTAAEQAARRDKVQRALYYLDINTTYVYNLDAAQLDTMAWALYDIERGGMPDGEVQWRYAPNCALA